MGTGSEIIAQVSQQSSLSRRALLRDVWCHVVIVAPDPQLAVIIKKDLSGIGRDIFCWSVPK